MARAREEQHDANHGNYESGPEGMLLGWARSRLDWRLRHSFHERHGEWRRRMGIEPTWDLVESHTGFEDRERHQVA